MSPNCPEIFGLLKYCYCMTFLPGMSTLVAPLDASTRAEWPRECVNGVYIGTSIIWFAKWKCCDHRKPLRLAYIYDATLSGDLPC